MSDQDHAHGGTHAFLAAAANLQIPLNRDFNGPRQDGVGIYQVTQRRGERWSAARAYLGDAGRRENLEILTEAVTERVLFEDGRVWGVAYQRDGQARVIRARRAVVLAAGAFQTPQLLMLSGIGPGAHLGELGLAVRIDRVAVGADLQDHIDYVAAFETSGSFFLGRSPAGTIKSIGAMLRWLATRKGPMTTPYAEAGGFLATDPGSPIPDVQLHFLIAIVEDHGRARVKGHGYSCHACVLRPESRGSVRLQSLDPRAAPAIDPAFLSDPRDMATLKRGVRAMYRIPPGAADDAISRPRPLSDRPGRRCRARAADPRARRHRLSSGGHRAHGIGRRCGVRSAAARARRRGALPGRCLGDAAADRRQHQCAERHDRRALRGVRAGGSAVGACSRPIPAFAGIRVQALLLLDAKKGPRFRTGPVVRRRNLGGTPPPQEREGEAAPELVSSCRRVRRAR